MSEITVTCEKCRSQIEGSTGSIYVRFADITTAQAATADWGERHPAGDAISAAEILTHPGKVHWRTAHDRCRIGADQDAYNIDAGDVATWPQVAHWTAELMAKRWFPLTDWPVVLHELAGEVPARRIRVTAREAV